MTDKAKQKEKKPDKGNVSSKKAKKPSHWTKEDMEKARPLPVPNVDDSEEDKKSKK